jgi:multiple sugar transport system substrate-binding protein
MAGGTGNAFADDIVLNFLDTQADTTYTFAIQQFEKTHPGITVREQKVPFDQFNAQVQARVGSGDTSVDLYDADPPRISALVSKGLLADLTSVKPEVDAKLLPATIKPAVIDGKLYAIPRATSMVLMYYNKDLLEKAGIPLPSADPTKRMTWEDVVADAKKAQAAGAKWGLSFGQIDRYYQLQPLYESSGAGSGLTGLGLLTPDVNSQKWVQTTDWYGKLFADGISTRGVSDDQTYSQFQNGQVAFYLDGPWQFSNWFKEKNLHWGIAPHPYFAGGKPVTPTDGWTIGISPHSLHMKEAIELALFVAENKDVALNIAATSLPPASEAAFPDYLKSVSQAPETKDWGTLLKYELTNTAVSRPKTIGYIAFEEIMNKAFSDVRDGSPAKDVLDGAEDQLNSVFARLH